MRFWLGSLLAVALLTGCSSYAVPRYGVSVTNATALKQTGAAAPISVGKFTATGESKKLDRSGPFRPEETKLGLKVNQIQSELDLLTGKKTRVELPPALKGKVIAVDPKYEFVVLDIGLDDGVLARGEMLVNRSGKLVARVRILTAESHRSVANVLSDWKQGEIMEGDVVLVGL